MIKAWFTFILRTNFIIIFNILSLHFYVLNVCHQTFVKYIMLLLIYCILLREKREIRWLKYANSNLASGPIETECAIHRPFEMPHHATMLF